jgi:hypothetical protein
VSCECQSSVAAFRHSIPRGYQLLVCPPTVFNLLGALFHHEWSETATVELSSYRDGARQSQPP